MRHKGEEIRDKVVAEAKLLDGYSKDVGSVSGDAQQLVGRIAYDSFRRVRRQFYDLVLKADVGVVDVGLHPEAGADHLHPEGRLAEGGGAAGAGRGLPAGPEGRRLMLGPLLIALALAASPTAAPKKGEEQARRPPRRRPLRPRPRPASAAAATPEKKDVTPGQKPKLGLDGLGRSPEEQKQLDDLQEMLRSYEAESQDFKRDVQLLVEKKYEEKRSDLAASYEKAIRDLEVIERKERLDAIAQFEEFLQRYPDEPRYTPDVMFRLAELYYERTATTTWSPCASTRTSSSGSTRRATPRRRPSRRWTSGPPSPSTGS